LDNRLIHREEIIEVHRISVYIGTIESAP
jgi:hypothetical protein